MAPRCHSTIRRPRFIHTPLAAISLTAIALSLRAALPSGLALAGLAAASSAYAADKAQAPAARKAYAIPPGALGPALTEFASQAGVTVQVDSRLLQGLNTSGIKGDFTVHEGFVALLKGTNLELVDQGTGIYLVQQRSAGMDGNASTLPAVTVTATPEATTEGSGSYAASTATLLGTAMSTKDIPSSVSVLTRQQMDDQNITTINDAMRYTTGVSSIDYLGNGGVGSSAYYTARGFPVNVALDGLSIAQGIQYAPQFDMAMYDRVETFRGPSGLLNGQGDLGGSVNLVRKKPTDAFQFKSETSIGSWANYRQMIDVSGPLNAEGTLRGRVVGVANTANSFLDGEHSREGMGYAVLEYDIDPRTTVSVSAGYQTAPIYQYDWGVGYDSANHLVIGPRGWSQNFAPDWNASSNTTKEATASLKHRFDSGWNAEATILSRRYHTYSEYAFTGDPDAGTGIADYEGQRQDITNDWLGLDAHVSGPLTLLGRKSDVLLGMNYSSYYDKFLGADQDLGNYSIFSPDIPEPAMPYTSGTKEKIDQFSLYGHINSHLTDRLTLALGGRDIFYKQQSQDTLPTASSWSTNAQENGKFVPYGGLIYALTPQVSAYASYSKIFSVQAGDTTAAGSTVQPFAGEQYEVGFKSSFLENRLHATVAAFRINGNHLAVGDEANPGYYLDSGAVRSQGWEAEISGSPLPNWNMIAGYTLANTAYTSSPTAQGQSYNGETPRNLFKLWMTYHFTQGALRGVTVGGGMYAQSSTWRYSPQYNQGGYAIFSAKVGYRFNSRLSADLAVDNLANRRYYNRAPNTYFAEYGAPRSVMLTVHASY